MNHVKSKKTEHKIIEALFTLLDKKALDKITIQEICDEADIHRSTFYKHFGSIFDVINVLIQGIMEELTKALTRPDSSGNVYEAILWFYQNNARAIRNVNKTKYKDMLDAQIQSGMEELVEKLFEMRHPENKGTIPEKWIIRYHAAGIVTLQEIFLTTDSSDEKTRMALEQFFEHIFR